FNKSRPEPTEGRVIGPGCGMRPPVGVCCAADSLARPPVSRIALRDASAMMTSAAQATRMSAFYSFIITSVQRGLYMQVSVETISGLERRMTVGIPAERIENEVNKRLQQTASRARV